MKYTIRVPLFNTPLILFVGDEEKEAFAKAAVTIGAAEKDAKIEGGTGRCCGSYLWIEKPRINELSHEVSHFADCMLDHLGVNDTRGEVRSYVIGYCMEKLWAKISNEAEIAKKRNLATLAPTQA